MKMIAARGYRNDISDVIGILIYAANSGRAIKFDDIQKAIQKLYGDNGKFKPEILEKIKSYTEMSVEVLSDL